MKINKKGGGEGWNKDVLSGKKIEKLTIGGKGGMMIIRDSRVFEIY